MASQAATTVTFNPGTAGPLAASVVIQTDGTPATLTVPLSGVGIDVEIRAQPTSLDFGSVQVQGTPASQQVTISNCGLSPATVTFPGLEGTQAGDFSAQGMSNATLQAGQAITINAIYQPLAMGTSTADLPYNSCAGCPNQTVGLTEVGVRRPAHLPTEPGGLPLSARRHPFHRAGDGHQHRDRAAHPHPARHRKRQQRLRAVRRPLAAVEPPAPAELQPHRDLPQHRQRQHGSDVGTYNVADPNISARTAIDPLMGNNTPGPCSLSFSPTALSFGQVAENQTGTQQVTLTNVGGSASRSPPSL